MVKSPRGEFPKDSSREIAPTSFPETTPRFGTSGHDFTLQAIIEMQRSIGELLAKTDRLIVDVKSQGEKIDSIRMRIAWVTGATAVVGIVVGLIFTLIKNLPLFLGR